MNYSLELIRLISVILITFTHTRNSFTEGTPFFLFEQLPQIGTVVLSVISGYLYISITSSKKNSLLYHKTKTLLIPFFIANIAVLIPISLAYYGFNINFLNRLNFDIQLITNGILALNAPPINPPTYFIRDIFIVFVWIDLLKNRNLYTLIILIPLLIWGKLFLNSSIPIMFSVGVILAIYYKNILKYKGKILILISLSILFCYFFYSKEIMILKYPVAILVFLLSLSIKIPFINVGAYTYLLHLYHSPIMVITYPILAKYIANPTLNVLAQITISILSIWILHLFIRRHKNLKFLCGGR